MNHIPIIALKAFKMWDNLGWCLIKFMTHPLLVCWYSSSFLRVLCAVCTVTNERGCSLLSNLSLLSPTTVSPSIPCSDIPLIWSPPRGKCVNYPRVTSKQLPYNSNSFDVASYSRAGVNAYFPCLFIYLTVVYITRCCDHLHKKAPIDAS